MTGRRAPLAGKSEARARRNDERVPGANPLRIHDALTATSLIVLNMLLGLVYAV